jgi:hypothetical protein
LTTGTRRLRAGIFSRSLAATSTPRW